jgi:glycosyltransferase involved in cell wall biosynthesis
MSAGTEYLSPLLLAMGWDAPGGLNRYVCDLHRALRGEGVAARSVVFGVDSDVPAGLIGAGPEDSVLPRRLWRQAAAARQGGPGTSVVDAHFALYALWPVVLGGLRDLPLVVHFHGPWAGESAVSSPERQWGRWVVERLVYRRAAHVVTLSAAFKRVVVESYGVAPWNIQVIPPGVDLNRFVRDRAGARAALEIDEATQVVFAARRLVHRMGLDVLIEAWSRLPPMTPGRRRQLLIAGSGPEREALEARVASLGLQDEVRFLGAIDDSELVHYYQAADLCVVPTRSLEGFGLVVLEALACGCPVVASDIGGLSEALADLDASLIVEPERPDLLSARLTAALNRGEVPSSEACRAYAERFTWSAAVSAHREVYRRAAISAGTPRKVRVVYLDHVARLSGGEIALSRLLADLPGVDAHVVLAEEGPLTGVLARCGVSTEVLAMADGAKNMRRGVLASARLPLATLGATAWYIGRLAWRLHRLRPDLVHTNSLKAAVYGTVAGRLAGVPVVWHARDRVAEDYLPRRVVPLIRVLARWGPAAVLANSQATLSTLPSGRRKGRIDVVLADPYRRSANRSPSPADPRAGLRIGMVGRLAPWKGQHVVLEAFAMAFPGGEDRLVVAGAALFGEDEYAQRLIDDAKRLGVAERVDFLGHVDDVERLLEDIDLLVHGSVVPEPFGQVVVEGMAAGLPVVAAAAGGPAEIVTSGVDGVLVAPGNVPALAAVLRTLAQDPDLRTRLGAAAKQTVAQYDPRLIGGELVKFYNGLLADRDLRR